MKVSYRGNVVTKDSVLTDSFVTVEDGIITYVGKECPENTEIEDYSGKYIMAGFIDIHCHASALKMATDNPQEVGDYHKAHGTTSMLLTYYRDVPHEKLLECLKKVKDLIGKSNVIGAHLEGPILNANFGTGSGNTQELPDRAKYVKYIESGVVKQWTSSPEVDGVTEMIKDISAAGIIPSIGHSKASYAQVKAAFQAGARLTTHIFDATGTTKDESTMDGTQDISFDEACMLMPDMFYEVICDKNWVHVKKEKLALLIKTVGIDRVIAITDSFMSDGNDQSDINVFYSADGKANLSGSKLTMGKVAKNLFNAGYTPVQVSWLTAYNAAKLLKLSDRGEIAVAKKADMVLMDENMKFLKVI
ncbi:MAG: amidohydrolase family protein [Clostridia bacterium]|nr:amidohydrolase family protein [Clostridia bacterium]